MQPDYFLTHMDEECRIEYGTTSRCAADLHQEELPALSTSLSVPFAAHATHGSVVLQCAFAAPNTKHDPHHPLPHCRCLICELPTLVVANQMLWSVHPVNPLKAGAGFHLGKRKSAETRLHEGWHLFLQR